METEEKQLEFYNSLIKYKEKRSQVLPDVAAMGADMQMPTIRVCFARLCQPVGPGY